MFTLLSGGELCVCEIMQALDISQSRASRNLGILRDAGLLVGRREGQWVHYSLSEEALSQYTMLLKLIETHLEHDGTIVNDREKLKAAVKLGKRG